VSWRPKSIFGFNIGPNSMTLKLLDTLMFVYALPLFKAKYVPDILHFQIQCYTLWNAEGNGLQKDEVTLLRTENLKVVEQCHSN